MNLFEKKIRATFILEALGKPAEYLTQTLQEIIEKMGKEKGIKIKEFKINEPAPLKNKEGFFSNFAEIDLEADSMAYLVRSVFIYMPAHVELVAPQQVSLTNSEWGELLSEITRKLHGYEEIVQITQVEKAVLERKLRDILSKVNNKKQEENKEKSIEKE